MSQAPVQSKKDFLNSKLNNLIQWIRNDKLLAEDNKLMVELNIFQTNYDKFLLFVLNVSNNCGDNCEFTEKQLNVFGEVYGVNINDYKVEQIEKLKRYLKCFVKTIKC